ncbi:MAG: hypothetical protein V2I26_05320, partial [Halieaceae bacterium]|nr:hypothetical protein [Halieaceae bacterium]
MDNTSTDLPLVEIGWLVAGKLDEVDLRATGHARQAVREELARTFPQFQWRMPLVHWEELTTGPRAEPAELLEYGVADRNAKHWDFAAIVTGAELVGHYR